MICDILEEKNGFSQVTSLQINSWYFIVERSSNNQPNTFLVGKLINVNSTTNHYQMLIDDNQRTKEENEFIQLCEATKWQLIPTWFVPPLLQEFSEEAYLFAEYKPLYYDKLKKYIN